MFSLFCPNPNERPTIKGVFLYFFHNPNHRPTTKRVLFYIFVLTKGLPKSVLFYIFAPTLAIGLPQRMSFSIIALTWTKGLPQKRAVLYIWPNQRSPKKCAFSIFLYTKGIFLHFCPYMNQRVLIYIFGQKPQKVFSLHLTKPEKMANHEIIYPNHRPTTKDVIFYSCPILTKCLPQTVFFLNFCPNPCHRPNTKVVSLFLP